jgi:hypothetical protein
MGDKRVYIMDVYNRHIYPGDRFAKGKLHQLPSSGIHTPVWGSYWISSIPACRGLSLASASGGGILVCTSKLGPDRSLITKTTQTYLGTPWGLVVRG